MYVYRQNQLRLCNRDYQARPNKIHNDHHLLCWRDTYMWKWKSDIAYHPNDLEGTDSREFLIIIIIN